MPDEQVTNAEREGLLAETAGSAPPPAPVAREPAPPPAVAPPPAPRAPSRLWASRRLIAGVALVAAGSAWTAAWMASERPAAAGLALLGIGAGAWVALRPKKY